MATHAKLSPSSSKRWMTCPGSIALIDSLNIEDKPSKYAAEGTVAHEIHERCLLKSTDAKEYLGETITVDGMSFTVNDNMVDAVQESVDYIREGMDRSRTRTGIQEALLVEVRCSLKSLGIEGLDGGTSDVLLINKLQRYIIVDDYKHGQGVAVEVENNTQMMSYALGALIELGIEPFDDWQVYMTISQPRAHHPDGRIRSTELSSDDIFEWRDEVLIPAAEATQDPEAPLVPSDDGCRFCPASGQCSALYAKTQELAIADFKEDTFPNPKVMTAEQKRIVMDHAVMIRAFIVAVEEQIRNEVDQGSEEYEDHYKLVRKTTHRKFVNDALDPDFSILLDYLEHDDLFIEKPLALGDIEKKLAKKTSKKKAKEIMSEITIKPEGGIVIAPITDKRQSVQSTLASDFDDLDEL